MVLKMCWVIRLYDKQAIYLVTLHLTSNFITDLNIKLLITDGNISGCLVATCAHIHLGFLGPLFVFNGVFFPIAFFFRGFCPVFKVFAVFLLLRFSIPSIISQWHSRKQNGFWKKELSLKKVCAKVYSQKSDCSKFTVEGQTTTALSAWSSRAEVSTFFTRNPTGSHSARCSSMSLNTLKGN